MKRRNGWTACLTALALLALTGCGQTGDAPEWSDDSSSQNAGESSASADASTEQETDEDESDEDGDTSASAQSMSMTAGEGAWITADDDDRTDTYDSFDAQIALSDGATSVTGDSAEKVTVDGDVITIADGGVYRLSGALSDGQIVVTGEKKVRLYLDGVSVSCSSGSALVCVNEKRTIVTLADGTENILCDGSDYTSYYEGEKEIDPCAVYVQDSFTINGGGSLTVSGNCADGMVCKDNLKLCGGTIDVTAVKNGVKGKDCVALLGADVTVNAGNDGLKATETESEGKGFVTLVSGTATVSSGGDCVSAESGVQIFGGTIDLISDGTSDDGASAKGIHVTGSAEIAGGDVTIDAPEDGIHADGDFCQSGGTITVQSGADGIQSEGDYTQSGGECSITTSGAVSSSSGNNFGGGNFGGHQNFGGGGSPMAYVTQTGQTDTASDNASSKGIKCGGTLTLSGGTCRINSTDHAVHCAGEANLCGTGLDLTAGKKGISAHGNLTISDGEIIVESATEGIESKANMEISGGQVRVLYASDDGLNTGGTGGQDTSSGEHNLTISGGYVFVCADCDGIDSNQVLTVSGGTIVVYGPTTGGDGSLDFGSSMTYSGGLLLALSKNGMMEYAQDGLLVTTAASASAGDTITAVDADGNVLLSVVTPKAVGDIILGADDASDCTLYVGGEVDAQYNSDDVATGGTLTGGSEVTISVSGNGFGGGMGGGMGGRGGGMGRGF